MGLALPFALARVSDRFFLKYLPFSLPLSRFRSTSGRGQRFGYARRSDPRPRDCRRGKRRLRRDR